MPEFINTLWSQVQGMVVWELLAVVCALIYLALAILEKISCWYFAFISPAIYTVIFWKVSLLMESTLQFYYFLMAVFGWWQWRKPNDESAALEIHCWGWRQHLTAIALILVLSVASGTLLKQFSQAAMPFLDSFTTWGAVITTYMVARKVLENWIYWFVIDGISIYLYLDRGLVFTAALFVLYEIMVVIGFWHWRKQMQQDKNSPALQAA